MQSLHPLILVHKVLVLVQLCQGKGSSESWHRGQAVPPEGCPPSAPSTCEDVGQELGQDVLLLLGQVLGPVPPDQARGVLVGVPHGPWCLCCRPAQAGARCQGQDEAEAQQHLHGCGETEQGWGKGGAAAWDMELGHAQPVVRVAWALRPRLRPVHSLLCPSLWVPKSPPSLPPFPQVFSILLSCLVPNSPRIKSQGRADP